VEDEDEAVWTLDVESLLLLLIQDCWGKAKGVQRFRRSSWMDDGFDEGDVDAGTAAKQNTNYGAV